MKLQQIVCDKSELTLTKEKKSIKYNEIFEVNEKRAAEILKATYLNKPVAKLVIEKTEKNNKKNVS